MSNLSASKTIIAPTATLTPIPALALVVKPDEVSTDCCAVAAGFSVEDAVAVAVVG
jgi:hypothetical protein